MTSQSMPTGVLRTVRLLCVCACLLATSACDEADAASMPDAQADAAQVDAAQVDAANLMPSEPLPTRAPTVPQYSVPVEARLEPFAQFDVREVHWGVAGGQVTLEYDFPSALTGIDRQEVLFQGSVIADGVAEISGAAGHGHCFYSAVVVRCEEVLDGLTIDAASARAMVSAQMLTATETNRRIQVIDRFSVDPIGILLFDPTTAPPPGN